jgi:hypothetical protein
MTPEQLLGLPDSIANLSDEQLTTHLAKFFPFTRPNTPMSHGLTVIANSSLGTPTKDEDPNSLAAKMRAAFAAQGLDPTGTKVLVKEKKKLSFL